MNTSIDSNIIYPNLKAAAAAVCQRWCQQQGYSDPFYQNGSWWAFPDRSFFFSLITKITRCV